MKKTVFLLFATLIMVSCKQSEHELTSNNIISEFIKNSKKIEKVEYHIQRIDTFPSGQNWNKKGFALVEKNKADKKLGISFYGESYDYKKGLLYENGKGYEIDPAEKKYQVLSGIEMKGSPGEQMLVENIFHLDSIYKNLELVEKENSYLLKYNFKPESLFDTIDSQKIVELRKKDFFPIKITYSAKKLGKNYFTQQILTDIKINNEVNKSVSNYKKLVSNFDELRPIKSDN